MPRRLEELLTSISLRPDCLVAPPAGLPVIPYQLPPDLLEFFSHCGGIQLFAGSEWELEICPPSRFENSNAVIILEECPYDRTHYWFICARSDPQYISIDLSSKFLGRCYDSFWDIHGIPGSCPIIAKSFTDFLERALQCNGNEYYWQRSDFQSLGDAYDD